MGSNSSNHELRLVECDEHDKLVLNELWTLQSKKPKAKLVPMHYYVQDRSICILDQHLMYGFARFHCDRLVPDAIIDMCLNYYVIFEEWDNGWKSDLIVITEKYNNRCTVIDNSNCFHTVLGIKRVKYGKHHWRIKLKEYISNWGYWRNVVGIVKTSQFEKSMLQSNICVNFEQGYFFIGWACHKTQSVITSDKNTHKLKPYGRAMVMFGDIVDIYLDLEYGTLSFALNGEYFGVSHRVDINTEYRLCITINGKDTSFQILSYTQQT
eukprot:945_1